MRGKAPKAPVVYIFFSSQLDSLWSYKERKMHVGGERENAGKFSGFVRTAR